MKSTPHKTCEHFYQVNRVLKWWCHFVPSIEKLCIFPTDLENLCL